MFFTDRTLYRPGQTVLFKCLLVNTDTDRTDRDVATNLPVTVDLQDERSQTVATESFISNAFGSVQGSFHVPQGAFTGRMTLRCQFGAVSIRVEEYKRPKFEVVMETVKGVVALGDTVIVAGTAKAFSGAMIDHAKVVYIVVRHTHFASWYSSESVYSSRNPPPHSR
ncbi:MAG: hypothetical protein IPP94_19845 [Ignavibacteria bacterium]|nr:hypothetical protein [Ignavibacteria bacterium]